jgi:hypothetical protein
MVTYKSNNFLVNNEISFQQLCGKWGLQCAPTGENNSLVSFRGELVSRLDNRFWNELAKLVAHNWVATIVEYHSYMTGFSAYAHLVTSKSGHDTTQYINLKFKKSVSNSKRRAFSLLEVLPKEEPSVRRPIRMVEAEK